MGPAGPTVAAMTDEVYLDFETTSAADLRRVGVYTYADHRSTRIICARWRWKDDPVLNGWRWSEDPVVLQDLFRPNMIVHAHNAEFEWVIWNTLLTKMARVPALDISQMRCSMARSLYWGLPASLDKVTQALDLPIKKDMDGHRLMMRMARPRSSQKSLLGGTVYKWWHEDDPAKVQRLYDYCGTDVDAEVEVCNVVPDLPDDEQTLWQINCLMNQRGVYLDKPMAERMVTEYEAEQDRLAEIMDRRTGGVVKTINSVVPLKQWFHDHGVEVPDCSRATMETVKSNEDLPKETRVIAAVRLQAAKSSTKKYKTMLDVAGSGNKLRGLTAYYGAGRTGRYAGRLVQHQNLPRPDLDSDLLDSARNGFVSGQALVDVAKSFKTTPLNLASDLIRTALVPEPGNMFVIGDFSQIEARVLAWLAGQDDILKVFEAGDDVYTHTAAKLGSTSRTLGKVLTLACGYQMGAGRFQETAETYGLHLSAVEAEQAVSGWRNTNAKIVGFWYGMDRQVLAWLSGGDKDMINDLMLRTYKLTFRGNRDVFAISLPSGRRLIYRNLHQDRATGALVFDGVRQPSGTWGQIETYGGKLVENVTQAVARDVMAVALRRVWASRSAIPVLTVHDELVCEVADDHAGAEVALRLIMTNRPTWAQGLPIACDVFTSEYYRK
jgi:DNA polymerase